MQKTYTYKQPASSGIYWASSQNSNSIAKEHFYAGVKKDSSTKYTSFIKFPSISEGSKEIIIEEAKLTLTITQGGPCEDIRFYITTDTNNPFEMTGVLAATFNFEGNVNDSSTGITEISVDLNNDGKAKIAELQKKGVSFYIQVISDNQTRIRFVGPEMNPEMNEKNRTFLTITYAEAISTGTLNTTSISLGSSITLSINNFSASYTHKVSWYLNNNLCSGPISVSGNSASYTYLNNSTNLSFFPQNSTSTKGKVVLGTYLNETLIGENTYSFDVNLQGAGAPTISSFSLSDGIKTTLNYTANYSDIYASFSAYGENITTYKITFSGSENRTFSFTESKTNIKLFSPTFPGVTIVTLTVLNSRGQETSSSQTITISSSVPPEIRTFNFYRANFSGQKDPEGDYMSGDLSFYFPQATTYSYSVKINNSIYKSESNIAASAESTAIILSSSSSSSSYSYTVTNLPNASYGFQLNSEGYYESQNKGENNSYAICRVNLNVFSTCSITFNVINYAENNYDFGIFGNLDSDLSLSYSEDSSPKKSYKGLSSSSIQTLTYSNVTAGSHFIDVKFIKDVNSSYYNDSVKFKLTTSGGNSWTYPIDTGFANVIIELTDSYGNIIKKTTLIPALGYLLHFKPTNGDVSIGIGSAASSIGKTLSIGWPVYLNGGIADINVNTNDALSQEGLRQKLGVDTSQFIPAESGTATNLTISNNLTLALTSTNLANLKTQLGIQSLDTSNFITTSGGTISGNLTISSSNGFTLLGPSTFRGIHYSSTEPTSYIDGYIWLKPITT